MRILVTGSEGNIGKVLVPYLKSQGHNVFGIDIIQKTDPDFMTVDINNGTDLINVFYIFRPEVVYHLAGMVSRVTCEKSKCTTIKTNIYGTENIIQLCKQFDAKLIFFSTSEVYGNIGGVLSEDRKDLQPNNFYGLSKLIGEQLVNYEVTNGLQAIIVRPFMFYHEDETLGEHRSAIIRFVESLLLKKKINVHKDSIRPWMHLGDGVKVLERLCYLEKFMIINIGNPVCQKMEDIAKLICDKLNLRYEDYVNEIDLPDQMTLTKIIDTNIQDKITNYKCSITIDEGLSRVIESVKKRSCITV